MSYMKPTVSSQSKRREKVTRRDSVPWIPSGVGSTSHNIHAQRSMRRREEQLTPPTGNVGRTRRPRSLSLPTPTFSAPPKPKPVKLSPQDLIDPDAFNFYRPAPVQDTPFHRNFLVEREKPKNRNHRNHLGKLPEELPKKERQEYMRQRPDDFPVLRVFTGDRLYHYSTEEGARGIQESGLLYPSVKKGKPFTHFGKGVYFTDLGPEQIREKSHDEVAQALFSKSTPTNLLRSQKLLEVDVSEMAPIEMRTSTQRVFLHSTTEPVDVRGKITVHNTSDLTRHD